jgi:hypothetical protein
MHYSIMHNNSINKNVCKYIKSSYIHSDFLHASANHVVIIRKANHKERIYTYMRAIYVFIFVFWLPEDGRIIGRNM